MASYTQNYQLHQWEPEDSFLRTDFNDDLQRIDEVLGSKGTCSICEGSYVGTGEYGQLAPNTIVLPFKAKMVILDTQRTHSYTYVPMYYILMGNASSFHPLSTSTGTNRLTWQGNTVSWYYTASQTKGAEYQFNEEGETYCYYAIG